MALDFPSPATVGQVFQNWQWDGTEWVAANASLTYPVTVPQGGTGLTSLPLNVVLKGAGTAAVAGSSITDAGSGVTIGSPAGGAQGAGTLALPNGIVINGNAAAVPAPGAGTVLTIATADTQTTAVQLYSAGATAGVGIRCAGSRGTLAAPTASQLNDWGFALVGQGYDGSAYATGARINSWATENWGASAHGAGLDVTTNSPAAGAVNQILRMRIRQGVVIGNTSADPGQGALCLNANAAALPAVNAGTMLHAGAADSTGTLLVADGFGTQPYLVLRMAGGTAASLAPTPSAGVLGVIQFNGYTGSAFAWTSQIYAQALEAYSASAQGSQLVFQTTSIGTAGAQIRMVMEKGVIIGNSSADPGQGALCLNANAAALPSGIAGMQLRVGQVDGTNCVVSMESFGAQPILLTRVSAGTAASLAAVASGTNLLYLQGQGYNGAGYNQGAAIILATNQAWTTSVNGTQINFYTTPIGTTGAQQTMLLASGLQLGVPTGGDKGIGSVNAQSMFVNNVAVSTSDQRLKENIEPSAEDALAVLRQIMLFDYTWKSTGPDDTAPRHDRCGFVAQQVPEHLRVPGPDEDSMVGVDTLQLLAHTVRAVQQVADRLEAVETQIRTVH